MEDYLSEKEQWEVLKAWLRANGGWILGGIALAAAGIYAWHGNFYALPLTETLGVEPAGLVRIGLLHYNTKEEVEYLLDVLKAIE